MLLGQGESAVFDLLEARVVALVLDLPQDVRDLHQVLLPDLRRVLLRRGLPVGNRI